MEGFYTERESTVNKTAWRTDVFKPEREEGSEGRFSVCLLHLWGPAVDYWLQSLTFNPKISLFLFRHTHTCHMHADVCVNHQVMTHLSSHTPASHPRLVLSHTLQSSGCVVFINCVTNTNDETVTAVTTTTGKHNVVSAWLVFTFTHTLLLVAVKGAVLCSRAQWQRSLTEGRELLSYSFLPAVMLTFILLKRDWECLIEEINTSLITVTTLIFTTK